MDLITESCSLEIGNTNHCVLQAISGSLDLQAGKGYDKIMKPTRFIKNNLQLTVEKNIFRIQLFTNE